MQRLIAEGIAELDCMEQEQRALQQHQLDIQARPKDKANQYELLIRTEEDEKRPDGRHECDIWRKFGRWRESARTVPNTATELTPREWASHTNH
jgi:hypothetical protein